MTNSEKASTANPADNLFTQVARLDALLTAALRASRKCPASPARAEFLMRMSERCMGIRDELLAESYSWGPYETKEVCDPKRRIIHKAPFRDRVVHQAIAQVLDPILERHLIHHTYACRTGKGTSHALETAMRWVRRKPYALRLDVSKYFASIDRIRLLEKLARIVPDHRLMRLLRDLVLSFNPGIPIGNLTSQLFANLYLNDLDQFIKRVLKVKEYMRYMDDLLILTDSKESAWRIRDAVVEFATTEKLRIPEHKTTLHPTTAGVPLLGYRLFACGRPRIHRRKIRRLGKCLRKAGRHPKPEARRWATIAGWYGSAHYGITEGLAQDLGILDEIRLLRRDCHNGRLNPRHLHHPSYPSAHAQTAATAPPEPRAHRAPILEPILQSDANRAGDEE